MWSEQYDRTAAEKRFEGDDSLDNNQVLQRELHPSVEYADDVLPLFSDKYAANYRLSCTRQCGYEYDS